MIGHVLRILFVAAIISGLAAADDIIQADTDPRQVIVFSQDDIRFAPDDTAYAAGEVIPEDNGRVISRTVELPEFFAPVTVTAHVAIHPIPKDEISVHDKWDRAGNVRMGTPDGPEIEIVKFITAYGGHTEYDVDVTHLAALLKGTRTFKAFIDTWVNPAWKVDFSLTFTPADDPGNPDWVGGLMYEESFTAEFMGDAGREVTITIPDDLDRVVMHYLVSGHCTDGRGADEFVPKDNVIYVDGRAVYRFRPWRDDCRQFRAINPYCRRWSDGYWSSDYSRSGWCPGDRVEPVEIDLTDHLTLGQHTVRFTVEDIRPKDADGHFGYWRISGYLLGWTGK